jgi:hypothetical protein
MKEIGGYFGLELPNTNEYHPNAICLNTGRNAFEYILKVKRYKKVYLPYYTCDVMLEPLEKLGLSYEFYYINHSFYPVFDFQKIEEKEVFVYTNYFGLCEKQVKDISNKIKNLIIDNSQAFYSQALPEIDTFYSPRKFFGIPDGAYLYTNQYLQEDLEIDFSHKRCEHLLGRLDVDAASFYQSFVAVDNSLKDQPIKQMSRLTNRLLSAIDYADIAKRRRRNFEILHQTLDKQNQLQFDIGKDGVPMVYPYLINNGKEIKQRLIENKIYVASYWPNVLSRVVKDSFEYDLVDNLVCLPIDQRYNTQQLESILSHINA